MPTMQERIAALHGNVVDTDVRQHFGGVGASAFGGSHFGDTGLRLGAGNRTEPEPLDHKPSLA